MHVLWPVSLHEMNYATFIPKGFFGYILDRDAKVTFLGLNFGTAYFFGSIICTVIFWGAEFLHSSLGSQVWVKVRQLRKHDDALR